MNNLKDLNKLLKNKNPLLKKYVILNYARNQAIIDGIINLEDDGHSEIEDTIDDFFCNELEVCWKHMTTEECAEARDIVNKISDLQNLNDYL